MVNPQRFCSIKKPEDFIALPRSDKSEFFAQMLKPAHIRKLSKAVEETAETDREMGGYLKMRKGALSLSFVENHFAKNLERYMKDLELLAEKIRQGTSLDDILCQNPQYLFGAEGALRFSEHPLFTAAETLNLSYGDVWNIFVIFANAMGQVEEARKAISEAIQGGYSFDRYCYDERFMHFLEKILGMQKVKQAYGRNSELSIAPKYLMEFHTHPWLPGFSDKDLEIAGDGKVPFLVLARSLQTIGNIDMFLAQPRSNGNVEDLGCIYSFRSATKKSADELAGSMITTVARGVARLKFD